MPQFVNTNVASINTQRSLNQSQGALQTSLQRLSSGLRINSAKDDAAGLAISERMTGQIRGMNQAMRNANDGISLSQTAESAMAETTNILQRIRELAVQSANATNNDTDRAALNAEVTQLTSELDRIASTTQFNGTKLLDGSFTAQQFQVGANVGETIDVASIASSRSADIGQTNEATAAGAAVTTALSAGDLTVNGTDVGAVAADAAAIATAISATSGGVTATATNTTATIAFAESIGTAGVTEVKGFNAQTSIGSLTVAATTSVDLDGTTITLTAATYADEAALVADFQAQIDGSALTDAYAVSFTGTVGGADFDLTISHAGPVAAGDEAAVIIANSSANAGTLGFSDTAGTAGTAGATAAAPDYTLSVDGTALNLATAGADGTINNVEVTALINELDGYTATAVGSTGFTITKADGSNISLIETGTDATSATEGLIATDATAQTYIGSVSVTSVGEDLVIGGAGSLNAGLAAATTATSLTGTTMGNTTVATVAGANAAIASVDAALTTINSSRADLGALQSRFESTTANLAANVENLSAARSRIRDTDFAVETAELTRVQILQQAGIAMLSQANSAPQNVLALLQ
jgi:flagellin